MHVQRSGRHSSRAQRTCLALPIRRCHSGSGAPRTLATSVTRWYGLRGQSEDKGASEQRCSVVCSQLIACLPACMPHVPSNGNREPLAPACPAIAYRALGHAPLRDVLVPSHMFMLYYMLCLSCCAVLAMRAARNPTALPPSLPPTHRPPPALFQPGLWGRRAGRQDAAGGMRPGGRKAGRQTDRQAEQLHGLLIDPCLGQ